MKHLFIINPKAYAAKGKTDELIRIIRVFFAEHPHLEYAIHVTRWCRDAQDYARRYVREEQSVVRVYAMGGTGTLCEVVNGVAGLYNAQVAFYPLGRGNVLMGCVEQSKRHLFLSVSGLIFGKAVPLDLLRFGNRFAVSFVLFSAGIGAGRDAGPVVRSTRLPAGLNLWGALRQALRQRIAGQIYSLRVDDAPATVGRYAGIVASQHHFYGHVISKAVRANPGEKGRLNLYARPARNVRRAKAALHRARSVRVSSPEGLFITADGEDFFEDQLQIELAPQALQFVVPKGVCPSYAMEHAGLSAVSRKAT